MGFRAANLTPPESAALTRLVISYCLGRGSLCVVSRSICLQLYHPSKYEEYAFYQWRRIRSLLPNCKPPRLHEQLSGKAVDPDSLPEDTLTAPKGSPQAQWRLRTNSIHFRTALNLLYPVGTSHGIELTSDALSLVGAEAMASLWADRGRLVKRRGSNAIEGWLNLSRYSFGSAATIAQWIASVSWAAPLLGPNPRYPTSPQLVFDHTQIARFLGVLGETWMAQAPTLAAKFALPAALDLQQRLIDERLALYSPREADAEAPLGDPNPMPRLRTTSEQSGRRRAPTLPPEIPAPR